MSTKSLKSTSTNENPVVDVTERFGYSRVSQRGVGSSDTSYFIFPEYENVQDDDGNVSTVVHAVFHDSTDVLVDEIDADAFSVRNMLSTGVVPQVVNPASFYRMDSKEAVQSVNAAVSSIKEEDIVNTNVEPLNNSDNGN